MFGPSVSLIALFVSVAADAGAMPQCDAGAVQLLASDGSIPDEFGRSVAVQGNRALVGSWFDDALGDLSGSAYVFDRDEAGVWNETAKLTASDGHEAAKFGSAVALFGDRALVGAIGQDDREGAAYVFEREASGAWTERAKLTGSGLQPLSRFGYALALWGDRAVVGAADVNRVFTFERQSNGVWLELDSFSTPGLAHWDGDAIAMWNDRAVIGVPVADTVIVLLRDATGSWSIEAEIFHDDDPQPQSFGHSVSMRHEQLLIGSPGETYSGNDLGGVAYLYEREPNGAWTERHAFHPSSNPYDGFGTGVALQQDRVLIGNWFGEEVKEFELQPDGSWSEACHFMPPPGWVGWACSASGDLGLIAAPRYEIAEPHLRGAAYVVRLGLGTPYCLAASNSTGAPAMLSTIGSTSVLANDVRLVAEPVPNQFGLFFFGPTPADVSFGNGRRCVGGSLLRLAPIQAQNHSLSHTADLSAPPLAGNVIPGSTWNVQAWFRDPMAGGAAFNTSSAAAILFDL